MDYLNTSNNNYYIDNNINSRSQSASQARPSSTMREYTSHDDNDNYNDDEDEDEHGDGDENEDTFTDNKNYHYHSHNSNNSNNKRFYHSFKYSMTS